ncbi:DNA cytosine methyltransferase [bacterium]|nr:DNA cytosine methyltransferase [bacterium]
MSLFASPKIDLKTSNENAFTAVGLFAGIGGIELGLKQAGWTTKLLCEIDPLAQAVLSSQFNLPMEDIVADVRDIRGLSTASVLAGGFPCQDLSQAGKTAGISGAKSGLVGEVFRLLETCQPKWLLLENVPFMLQLDRGKAMDFLATELERRGFTWAYRTVNTRSFGLPHRRKRVILVASQTHDPRGILLNEDAGEPNEKDWRGRANGFYWTEGLRGVGWGVDCVPTLKCGSSVGIPSPPAIWLPEGRYKYRIVTPTIEQAEMLQGFPKGWTQTDPDCKKAEKARWKMIGNSVSVPVSQWVGNRLRDPQEYLHGAIQVDLLRNKWPTAAWGNACSGRFAVPVSAWPVRKRRRSLSSLLGDASMCKPLSERATAGFLSRLERSTLKVGGSREDLIDSLKKHITSMRSQGKTPR